jgi:hypothetical protein
MKKEEPIIYGLTSLFTYIVVILMLIFMQHKYLIGTLSFIASVGFFISYMKGEKIEKDLLGIKSPSVYAILWIILSIYWVL